jgi:hypothetical protein
VCRRPQHDLDCQSSICICQRLICKQNALHHSTTPPPLSELARYLPAAGGSRLLPAGSLKSIWQHMWQHTACAHTHAAASRRIQLPHTVAARHALSGWVPGRLMLQRCAASSPTLALAPTCAAALRAKTGCIRCGISRCPAGAAKEKGLAHPLAHP